MAVATIEWKGRLPGTVEMIDQTLLPGELKLLSLETPEQMWEAIRSLRVRGAPAIGIAAAFAGFAGGFFAPLAAYINPESFPLLTSIIFVPAMHAVCGIRWPIRVRNRRTHLASLRQQTASISRMTRVTA